MSTSSLLKMASRACIKNIRSITDVGEAPYPIVRSILFRVENPEQLRQIELASPQICGPDGEIWLEFIKRDVANWDRKPYEPENPKKWYKAYRKLLMDSQKEVEDDVAALKATLDKIKQNQALHKAQQVELKGVPVPEGMKSNGPVISLATMPKFHDRVTYYKDDSLDRLLRKKARDLEDDDFRKDEEAKTFVSSKSKLDKFRKEAKAMSHFQKPTKRPGIWTPTEMRLRTEKDHTKITTAPRALIEEHRKAAIPTAVDPSIKPAEVFAPKRKRVEHEESRPRVMTNEEREKRLKAFTNPPGVSKATPTPAPTSPVSKSAMSPPRKATVPSSTAVKPATPLVPKKEATSSFSSPPRRKDRASPALAHEVPKAKNSSPSNGVTRPGMPMKKKAPVDIFIPAKRRKIS